MCKNRNLRLNNGSLNQDLTQTLGESSTAKSHHKASEVIAEETLILDVRA